MYPEHMVAPMRQELTDLGVQELRTPEDVDNALQGLTLVVINSVCGCAAGNARPAIKLALQGEKVPKIATVFAGVDSEATQKLRSYIEFPPSSPAMALFKDKEVVFMLHRQNIEGRSPEEIAQDLKEAFSKFV